MPPWNSPNTALTTKSATTPSAGRKRNSATPCSAEPRASVASPPRRSMTAPKRRREAMPVASIRESISAPRCAP